MTRMPAKRAIHCVCAGGRRERKQEEMSGDVGGKREERREEGKGGRENARERG
jgi:hypothetical protein